LALIEPGPNGLIYNVKKFRDEHYLKAFGENLRRLRLNKNLSQEDLAGKSETTLSQVGRIERGERAPTILTVLVLAKALEVHPKQLLDFEFKSVMKNQ